MRAVIQRVLRAKVTVDDEIIGKIGKGILIFIGIADADAEADALYILEKALNLRMFEDAAGKMNASLLEVNGEILVVSQFTLYGDARRGRRPSFSRAAAPDKAKRLYDFFVGETDKKLGRVETGQFQAMMAVELINDGPVTVLLDSEKQF